MKGNDMSERTIVRVVWGSGAEAEYMRENGRESCREIGEARWMTTQSPLFPGLSDVEWATSTARRLAFNGARRLTVTIGERRYGVSVPDERPTYFTEAWPVELVADESIAA